jgi:hypothetical protein
VTATALAALPKDVPAFVREGRAVAEHHAVDVDVLADRVAQSMRPRERYEHWLDVEYLEGAPAPARRGDYEALMRAKKRDVSRAGTVLYATGEWADALAVAFAEHRAWPDDEIIRHKVLARIGRLSHYAADLTQPLHTTIHWDGRADAEGRSPRTGVHFRMDALLGALAATSKAKSPAPVVIEDVSARLRAELAAAHALVDDVYEREKALPDAGGRGLKKGARALARERLQAASGLLSSLVLTAWRRSASLELPDWVIEDHDARAAGR